jgi:glycosyltransferase involved in cell wall biosynthesis
VKVTFLVPSTKRTIGGVIALYEFANGLSRRGHDVHLVHVAIVDGHIERLDDLAWFPFDPRVQHHLADALHANVLPHSDFIELTALELFGGPTIPGVGSASLPLSAGLPFLFVQGFGIFPSQVDERAFRGPFPKVCIARWLAGVLRDKGVPPRQIEYVPYGLDHATFRLVRALDDRPLQVAMLYNAHPIKGAQFGLAAIEEVRRRIPEVRGVAFGNKDPVHPMPDGVTFVKLPPRRFLVDEIYNGSRVFLCSSISEGFGFCAIEAMAGGCAVVTTDNGGSDDYAIDGETALVCAPRDVMGMADRVETLLRDDALRTSIATRGCESVQRFDWDDSARRLEQFLERYAEEPARFQQSTSGE